MNTLFRAPLFLLLSAAVSLTAMRPYESHASLITNGSFELGNYDNSDSDGRPDIMLLFSGQTALPGWTVNGNAGVHWMDIREGSSAGPVSDGFRSMDLQGMAPDQYGFSSLSTEFDTTIGHWYRLTFDAYSGLQTPDNIANVSVGTVRNHSFSGGTGLSVPASFETLSLFFQATEARSKLTFEVVASNGYGPVIDNVSVHAVPEPSSFVLMGTGASLLACFSVRRRNRRFPAN